ncbi:MAG: DUF6483 family protein [Eubacteriales bacterium]|nr:DUF6483 family protein [Eubacteriales bacterium]
MFQRDYILRLIEMMGELARRIGEMLDEMERKRLLDQKSRDCCGVPLSTLENVSAESLCELLAVQPRLLASEVLYLRAAEAVWEQREALLLKSLRLLASLHEEGPLCETRLERMTELKAAVLPLLTADDLMACACFFSQAEGYGEMEDALFQALEPERGCACPRELARRGAEMLRRAAHADEQTLILCGMTSRELELSAQELRQRYN